MRGILVVHLPSEFVAANQIQLLHVAPAQCEAVAVIGIKVEFTHWILLRQHNIKCCAIDCHC